MIIHHKINNLQKELARMRQNGDSVCCVPTMGALHSGHMSLIQKAKSVADVVVCSIFVNPAQFNEETDLVNYPRTIGEDLRLLDLEGCDIVFIPEVREMYPKDGFTDLKADYGPLSSTLEGEKRPGHFDGVVTVVHRLFEIVQPDSSCFGLKDFQQLSIIRAMVKERQLEIDVIGCDIVREPSGLAMSSRNLRLNPEDRNKASIISKTLVWIKENLIAYPISELRQKGLKKIENEGGIEIEYLEFVDPDSFEKKDSSKNEKPVVVLFAGWISGIRLIDNILIED